MQRRVLVDGVMRPELRTDCEHDVGGADDGVCARPPEVADRTDAKRIPLGEHPLAARGRGHRNIERPGPVAARLSWAWARRTPLPAMMTGSGGAVKDLARPLEGGLVDPSPRTWKIRISRVDARHRHWGQPRRRGRCCAGPPRPAPGSPVIACFSASWTCWTACAGL